MFGRLDLLLDREREWHKPLHQLYKENRIKPDRNAIVLYMDGGMRWEIPRSYDDTTFEEAQKAVATQEAAKIGKTIEDKSSATTTFIRHYELSRRKTVLLPPKKDDQPFSADESKKALVPLDINANKEKITSSDSEIKPQRLKPSSETKSFKDDQPFSADESKKALVPLDINANKEKITSSDSEIKPQRLKPSSETKSFPEKPITEITVFELRDYYTTHNYSECGLSTCVVNASYAGITGNTSDANYSLVPGVKERGIRYVHTFPDKNGNTYKLNFYSFDLTKTRDSYINLLRGTSSRPIIMISFNSDNYSSNELINCLNQRSKALEDYTPVTARIIFFDYGMKNITPKETLLERLNFKDKDRVEIVTSIEELSTYLPSLSEARKAEQALNELKMIAEATNMTKTEPSPLSRMAGFSLGIITGFGGGFTAGFVRPGFTLAPVSNIICALLGAVAGIFRGAYLGAKHGIMPRLGVDAPVFHIHEILSRRTINIPCADNTKVERNRTELFQKHLMFREQNRNNFATFFEKKPDSPDQGTSPRNTTGIVRGRGNK